MTAGRPGFSDTALEKHVRLRRDTYTGFAPGGLPVSIDFQARVPINEVVRVLNVCARIGITDLRMVMPEQVRDGQ